MVDPPGLQSVTERTHHMLLADQFGETLWTPFSC